MSNRDNSNGSAIPSFELRAARQEDYDYVEGLYVGTMKPLLSCLDAWDPEDALAKFRSYYELEEISIITLDDRDIGFLQVQERAESVCLDQIHIEAAFRSCGIGTALIQELLRNARIKNRPVLLSLVKHNLAQALYERLGFRVVGQDETKVHMRIDP